MPKYLLSAHEIDLVISRTRLSAFWYISLAATFPKKAKMSFS